MQKEAGTVQREEGTVQRKAGTRRRKREPAEESGNADRDIRMRRAGEPGTYGSPAFHLPGRFLEKNGEIGGIKAGIRA